MQLTQSEHGRASATFYLAKPTQKLYNNKLHKQRKIKSIFLAIQIEPYTALNYMGQAQFIYMLHQTK